MTLTGKVSSLMTAQYRPGWVISILACREECALIGVRVVRVRVEPPMPSQEAQQLGQRFFAE